MGALSGGVFGDLLMVCMIWSFQRRRSNTHETNTEDPDIKSDALPSGEQADIGRWIALIFSCDPLTRLV
ncbi:MAG: hypothetical protein AAF224_03100 [Pseudomonadota bacterium]